MFLFRFKFSLLFALNFNVIGYIKLWIFPGVEENTRDKCSSVENLIEVIDPYADNNGSIWLVCLASLPLTFSSYLNNLKVKQIYGDSVVGMKLNATVTVKKGNGKA